MAHECIQMKLNRKASSERKRTGRKNFFYHFLAFENGTVPALLRMRMFHVEQKVTVV
jgi:hypothetical protein